MYIFNKYFLPLVALAIINSISFNTVMAQELNGEMIYFGFGYQNIDLRNLNEQLRNNNLPELMNDYTTVGMGMLAFDRNNFLFGLEGNLMAGNDYSNNFYISNFIAYNVILNFGYNQKLSSGFSFAPMFGFGAGEMLIKIYDKQNLDFSDIMNNPKRGSELSQEGMMLNIGLNLFYNKLFNRYGTIVGLSVGYHKFLEYRNWRLFDREVVGSPKSGLTGVYVKFILGFGRFE